MSIQVKYIGTQQRWPELSITGKQSVWMPGQTEPRDDAEAAKLMATGLFASFPQPLTATISDGGIGITDPKTGTVQSPARFANAAYGLPKVLVFGCSIAQQCNAYLHSTTSTTSGFTPAKSKTLQVTNGALFAANDRIALPLYNARMYVATVESVAANVLTLTAPLPAGVRTDQAVCKLTATQTMANLLQGIGAGNSGVILLGSPAEVLPAYGYGGALFREMYADLERDLRYYRPHVVIMHPYENDLTVAVASGGRTLDELIGMTKWVTQLCLSYGATPVMCSSMPYYKPSGIGIPAVRTADFDGLRDYLCKPVSNGQSQYQIDFPGSYGLDLSTPWCDPDFINDAAFARRPIYAKLLGGTLTAGEQAMSAWTGITNGAFAVTLDGTPRTISGMNFSAATSMDQVASIIRTAMGSNGLCAWDATAGRFILRSPASISYVSTPGSGTDISAQIKATSALASAAPTKGWTDGVHPNTSKRFAIGANVEAVLKNILPPARSWLDYVLTPREASRLDGTTGSVVNMQAGSVAPRLYAIQAYGTAVATSTKNADGSLKIVASWPGAADFTADYVNAKYSFTFPTVWPGATGRYKVYMRYRVNSSVGIAHIYPSALIAPGYDNHAGNSGSDMHDTHPTDGRVMLLTTPHFEIGPGNTSIELAFRVAAKTAASPANAAVDMDVFEFGLVACHPETPHGWI